MAKFNKGGTGTKTKNLAGGDAFKETPELELVSLLLTSFCEGTFYESSDARADRLVHLIDAVDPRFAMQAAIFARNEFGMRSVSHLTAVAIALQHAGHKDLRAFATAVVRRPDDITEIVALYLAEKGKTFPNSFKKGLAAAFDKFDEYQLAKYRAEDKEVKLIDAVRLLHPRPTEKNGEALAKLVKGELRSVDTFEAKLTQAGQKAENEEDKAKRKAEAWADLILGGKIGQMALLKNLRNIEEQATDEVLAEAYYLLRLPSRVRKSMIMPFRYYTAAKQVNKPSTVAALSEALDVACANVPGLEGRTFVVVDDSGSMGSALSAKGDTQMRAVAALFAAVVAKAQVLRGIESDRSLINAPDIGLISGPLQMLAYNPADSALGIAGKLAADYRGMWTDFTTIFTEGPAADRIIILSDMQSWVEPGVNAAFEAYKKRHGVDTKLYCWDLTGNGSLQFPERNVYCMSGWSDKALDTMAMLEQDRAALVNQIKAVEL